MHKSCININLQTLKNTSKEEKTMIILCDMIDRDEDKSKFARIYSLYKYTM